MKGSTWIAIAAACLLASAATAADGTARGEAIEDFSEVDLNDDGSVDREEYHRRMNDMFFHGDTNKDGSLDRVELEAIREEMVLKPADADENGSLDLPEYVDERFDHFRNIDDDSDGVLSQEEVIKEYESNWD
jgi:Ca2+-binding EF-hand superfamily protein